MFSEAPDLPKHNKFWEIQKRFTKTFDSWLLPQYCWVCLNCQIYIDIVQRIVIAGSSPLSIIDSIIIIHARMSSPSPPRVTSSLNLPVQLLAPPAMPSLVDCFPLLTWENMSSTPPLSVGDRDGVRRSR